jgi:Na+-driven multidrug efflux pump
LLAHKTRLAENGVFLSVVLAEIFMVAASVMLFKQGRWKRQKI